MGFDLLASAARLEDGCTDVLLDADVAVLAVSAGAEDLTEADEEVAGGLDSVTTRFIGGGVIRPFALAAGAASSDAVFSLTLPGWLASLAMSCWAITCCFAALATRDG